MNKLKVLLLFLSLVLCSNPLWGRYCTDRNWETVKNLYDEQQSIYNSLFDDYDALLEEHIEYQLLSERYTLDQFSMVWAPGNTELQTSVLAKKTLAQKLASKYKVLQDKIENLIKLADIAARLWESLADYCYDEGEYGNNESAVKNKMSAEGLKKAAQELEEMTAELKQIYRDEVSFIDRSKERYDELN